MVVKINRLFHGFASVRDYQVEACEKNRQDMIIVYNGASMIIPWNELSKGLRNTEVFISKHQRKNYTLVDYDWKPQARQMTFL